MVGWRGLEVRGRDVGGHGGRREEEVAAEEGEECWDVVSGLLLAAVVCTSRRGEYSKEIASQ